MSICFFGSEITWLSDEFKSSEGFIDLEERKTLNRVRLVKDRNKGANDMTKDERLEQFANNLESAGMFSRRYDVQKLQDLYNAGSTLHTHLCRLDGEKFSEVKHTSVVEFANAYAKTCGYLRKL